MSRAVFSGSFILFLIGMLAASATRADESKHPDDGRNHQLGLDLGSGLDTDPDILEPFLPKGIDRFFEWDYRILIRDDAVGAIARYQPPSIFGKLTLSYRRRMDVPARAGLASPRNDIYETVGQDPPRLERGFILGAAAVFNPHWGVSVSNDELSLDDSLEHLFRRRITFAFGYSPLGNNQGKPWNVTIEPSVHHETTHRFRPNPSEKLQGFGYSLGPVYHYGLDWVRIPGVIGPGRELRMDRFKAKLGITDSETADFAVDASLNITAYATRFLKLSVGTGTTYLPVRGNGEFHVDMGASLRIGWSDLRF